MSETIIATIRFRRGTAALWAQRNPTPASGEPCLETDTGLVKVGNGIENWNTLDYLAGAAITGLVERLDEADVQIADIDGQLATVDERIAVGVAEVATTPTLVNPSGLGRLRRKLGRAFFERLVIIAQGTSIEAGASSNEATGTSLAQSTRWALGGWVGQLRRFFAATYGDLGEGMIYMAAEEARWTYTGTSASVAVGVASTGRRWTTPGTATITATATGVDVEGVRRNGAVAPAQNLTGGAIALLYVDGTDVTPNALKGSGTAGVADLTGGWVGQNGTLAYLVEGGENVIQHTCTVAGAANSYSPLAANGFPVVAGKTYMLTAEAFPVAFVAASVWLSVRWYDAANVQISETPGNTDTTVRGQIPANTWTPVTRPVTAPVGAVRAAVFLSRGVAVVGEVVRWRRIKPIPLDFSTPAAGNGTTGPAVDATIYRYGVDGLSDASHEVQLRMGGVLTDVAPPVFRRGPRTTPGVVVHRAGRSGSTTVEHVGAGWSTGTKTDLLATTYEAIETPTLVIIGLFQNDWNRQTTSTITPTIYAAHLSTLIAKIVGLGGCVLLVAGARWEADDKPFLQQDYADAARALATPGSHVAFIDLAEAWGNYAEANAAGFMYDSPHPNLSGHGDMARIIHEVLTRTPRVA